MAPGCPPLPPPLPWRCRCRRRCRPVAVVPVAVAAGRVRAAGGRVLGLGGLGLGRSVVVGARVVSRGRRASRSTRRRVRLGGRRGLRLLLVVGALGRRAWRAGGRGPARGRPELGVDAARQLLRCGLGALDGGVGAAAAAVDGDADAAASMFWLRRPRPCPGSGGTCPRRTTRSAATRPRAHGSRIRRVLPIGRRMLEGLHGLIGRTAAARPASRAGLAARIAAAAPPMSYGTRALARPPSRRCRAAARPRAGRRRGAGPPSRGSAATRRSEMSCSEPAPRISPWSRLPSSRPKDSATWEWPIRQTRWPGRRGTGSASRRGEHVLPHRVARAGVVEADDLVDVARARARPGSRVPPAIVPPGPLRGERRAARELGQREVAAHGQVVVADQAQVAVLAGELDAGVGVGAVADEVAQAPDRVVLGAATSSSTASKACRLPWMSERMATRMKGSSAGVAWTGNVGASRSRSWPPSRWPRPPSCLLRPRVRRHRAGRSQRQIVLQRRSRSSGHATSAARTWPCSRPRWPSRSASWRCSSGARRRP